MLKKIKDVSKELKKNSDLYYMHQTLNNGKSGK